MYQRIFISLVISSCLAGLSLAKNVFSVDLIHRDSLFSPIYNHSQTSSELLRKAVYRSFSHINHSHSYMLQEKYIETTMDFNHGDYLMSLSVGNSYNFLAFATFGSSFIWMNCYPCTYSYDNLKLPLFDLAYRSEYYSKFLFRDVFWKNLSEVNLAEGQGGVCTYTKEGTSSGILIKETFNLGPTPSDGTPPLFVLGCSDTTTIDLKGLVQGYVGLGSGDLSFTYQFGNQVDDHMYSYCLPPRSTNANAKIRFGYQENNLETRVSTSYILEPSPSGPYYYIHLDDISVGGEIESVSEDHYSYIILDAGRTMASLPRNMFDFVKRRMIRVIDLSPIADATNTFSLCFRDKDKVYSVSPTVKFYFDETTVLELEHKNTFVEYNDLICLAFIPNDHGIYLFGNIAQSNFQVEYDLQNKRVSFAPTDCTSW